MADTPTPPEFEVDDCPHCYPKHGSSHRTAWGVRVGSTVDSDGQPEYLIVQPTAGAHVAQADADWLFQLIRDRVCVHVEDLPRRPEPVCSCTKYEGVVCVEHHDCPVHKREVSGVQ